MRETGGRILVTGFAPFLGDAINPTQRIAETLGREFADRLDAAVLPVSFRRAETELAKLWRPEHSALLMFGQARGRARLSMERVALNWIETAHPDEDAVTPVAGPIRESGPIAVINELPLGEWRERLEILGVPAEISFSAGGYVCNHLLYAASQMAAGRPYLFAHVPVLPEQVKAGEASMAWTTMMQGARELARFIAER